eukprot:CAMPEP_0171934792 /NCGR_PEP_ID=MMETSP0993-20121228/32318_1 /TAXON_ID=483369 /ORGANISM="non described non described, Strain CCMP2098" /LENGTH=63 /DNA_ID=CAMNT_0012575577 /DNA_START=61 /DNA_END=248 /DNA_ORIENTATION=+
MKAAVSGTATPTATFTNTAAAVGRRHCAHHQRRHALQVAVAGAGAGSCLANGHRSRTVEGRER